MMDKPTPPKTITTRMLGTGPAVEFVFLTDAIAHGEAMAAWGAAQERERMQARIDALMLEHCPDEMSDEQKRNWAANQVPSPAARRLTVTTETKPDMIDRLQDEADLCRNEGATDIAVLLDEAADEIETLRAQMAQYKEDAERLHYVLRRLPGSIIRALIGNMSDTGDIHEFRSAIDKARKA